MSHRNSRRPAPGAAVKAANARRASVASSTSTFDLSSNDNDNYSAVDDISDDEDDDEDDVFAVEEQAIMGESSPSPPSTPRPHFHGRDYDGTNDDDSYDDNDDEEEEEESGSVAQEPSDDDASWNGIKSDSADLHGDDFLSNLEVHITTQRRVRFNVPTDDSSSESTEDDDHAEMYPDIFVDQSTLDPSFRRQIENEQDESSASDSFWDHTALYNEQLDNDSDAEDLFGKAGAARAFQEVVDNGFAASPATNADLDGANDLDGYETDGETTEVEDIPDAPICRKISSSTISDGEDTDSEAEAPATRRRKDQPRVSRFNLDKLKKKPIAVYNTKTGKMMIFTPNRQRHLELSPDQFHMNSFHDIPWSMDEQMSPLVGNNADLMFSPVAPDFINHAGMNGLEDVFGIKADASPSSFEDESQRDSDQDPETGLRVSDFIDLDNNSSSDEDDAPRTVEPSSTPARPVTASSDADVLSHLNPATVGAFRRNQVNSQLMIRNQASQDSLDFSGPFNSTAIRGIRSDRFDTAAVPLTPVRRHKKQLSDYARSPLEPLSAKRKASADAGQAGQAGHKKQKSISDVGALQL